MSLDSYKIISNRLFTIAQVPVSIVNEKAETLYCMPNTEHHFWPEHLLLHELAYFHNRNLPQNIPCLKVSSGIFYVGMIELQTGEYAIIGPATSQKLNLQDMITNFSKYMEIENIHLFYRVYEQSSLTDPIRFANILSEACYNFCGHTILPMDIIHENAVLLENAVTPLPIDTLGKNPDALHHFTKALISSIACGNKEALAKLWENPLALAMKNLGHSLETEMFYMIPYFTLICHAAVEGNAPTTKVLQIFGTSIQLLHKQKDINACFLLAYNTSFELCDLVRESNGKAAFPQLCLECERYINDHISEKIKVSDLAKVCGVSVRKIYYIFENNFHVTFTEYVQKERLRRAIVMLNSTNFSIAQISSRLGFSSHSYFTDIFTKHYGCTPSEYRSGKKTISEN